MALAKLVWRFILSSVGAFVALLVVSTAVSMVADMLGAPSFAVHLGPVELYSFTKEPDGFQGHLGGGAFWLALLLGAANAIAVQLRIPRRP